MDSGLQTFGMWNYTLFTIEKLSEYNTIRSDGLQTFGMWNYTLFTIEKLSEYNAIRSDA